jgi:HK97 family phage portal protein
MSFLNKIFRRTDRAQEWREVMSALPAVKNETLVSTGDSAAILELFGLSGASSGKHVTESTAMQVSVAYACARVLAGAVSQLPIHQYRLLENGDRERVSNTAVWWMLNESPSARWTAAAWKQYWKKCVLMRGDAFTWIVRGRLGEIKELLPLHPDNVIPQVKNNRLFYSIWSNVENKYLAVDQDDMLHFTGFGFDGCKSMSVIKWAARNALGNALAANEFAGKSFAEGLMPQILLRYPSKFQDETQKDFLRKRFAEIYGGTRGRSLPLVLEDGADARELSFSPEDAQLLETRMFENRDICTAFGVPGHMVGQAADNDTGWGSGLEQKGIGFVVYRLQPDLTNWKQELNRKIFRGAGNFFEFETDALMQGDSKAQADYFRAALGGPGIGDGWMSVDAVRKLKNMPVLGGEYEKPFRAQRNEERQTA